MKQYIDKSALAAELESLMNYFKTCLTLNSYEEGLKEGRLIGYEDVLDKINTIEVKEVDLEKEVEDWVKTGPHTSYPWCTIPDAIRITAEHFYELGLKTKGK